MEHANSPLVVYTRLSPYNSGKRKHVVDRITPHMFCAQTSLEDAYYSFADPTRQVSANYVISRNGNVGLYVEEDKRSWCSSNPENDDRAVTIECASDNQPPYAFNDNCYQSLISLCADICQRHGKTKLLWFGDKGKTLAYQPAADEMVLTIHMWFSNTECPGQWMLARMGELADRVTALLADEEVAAPIEPPAESDDLSADKSHDPAAAEPHENPAEKPEPPASGLQASSLKGLSNGEVIRKVAHLFTADHARTGIPASLSLAQFLLETGFAQEYLVQHSNNGFGMKVYLSGNSWPGSTWDGVSKETIQTQEYKADGTPYTITASFRKYLCLEDSIADHSAYLLGAKDENGKLRYAGLAWCADYKKAAQILIDGGYATSPDYAAWLVKLIDTWGLTQYDVEPPAEPSPAPGSLSGPEDDIPGISAPVEGLLIDAGSLSEQAREQIITGLEMIIQALKGKG